MADGEVRAQDLAQETASTLSGNEQFVMFDSTAGKRADIDDVATYVAGDKTTLKTTNKTSPVAAINENFDAIADVKEDLGNTNDVMSEINGIILPNMEKGYIAFSTSAMSYQDSDYSVRTERYGEPIYVSVGDVIELSDKETFAYKYAVYSNGTYYYSDYTSQDAVMSRSGQLFITAKYIDGSIISSPDIFYVIRINKHNGILNEIESSLNDSIQNMNMYTNILENGQLISDCFLPGEISNGKYSPTRKYRVTTPQKEMWNYDMIIRAESGYRFSVSSFVSMDSDESTWSGWVTSYTIPANTPCLIMLAKVNEDTSVVADPSEFVTHYIVSTDFKKIVDAINVTVDEAKIKAHMSRLYDSNIAESYVFFTDPHLMGTNGTYDENTFNYYMNYLKTVVDKATVDFVVCGGDWLNNGDTKAQASYKLGVVDGKMRELFGADYYPMTGNHDFNYLGVDGNGNRLPSYEWISNNAMKNFWFYRFEHCYYKYDGAYSKYYVLDTRTDHDGTQTYDETMLDWLASNLIEDDPIRATIMFHIMYLSGTTIPTRILALGEIISAFNNHTTCVLTEETHEYAKTYDFTNTTGHIDYCIVGHSHADFNDTLGGVPVIGCINFTNGDVASFDLVFADYTNRKVYTTRIGTGSNREFDI